MTSPTPSDSEERLARAAEAISERFVDLGTNLTILSKDVREETAARNAKVDALGVQSRTIRRLSRVNILLAALLVLLLGFLLVMQTQNNSDAKDRAAAATAQRNQQAADSKEVLRQFQLQQQALGAAQKKQDGNAAATAWCTKQSATISDYKTCLGGYGITLPDPK